jgi:hypothetical protein
MPGGRPKGSRNTIRYRERLAREALTLRIPVDASPEAHRLGKEARAILLRALRSTDPKAFRRPRPLAALYVLSGVGRPTTLADLLDDLTRAAPPRA